MHVARKAYPAETTEAFCDAHVAAKLRSSAVCLCRSFMTIRGSQLHRILGDADTQTDPCILGTWLSHYLFEDRFGRPFSRVRVLKRKVEGDGGIQPGATSWVELQIDFSVEYLKNLSD